jgi:hypothetical protein
MRSLLGGMSASATSCKAGETARCETAQNQAVHMACRHPATFGMMALPDMHLLHCALEATARFRGSNLRGRVHRESRV